MKVKAKETKSLEDGKHTGILSKYEKRESETGEFLIWTISEIDGDKNNYKTFVTSTNLSDKSVLGGILMNVLGTEIEPNEEYDLDILLGKKVVFQSTQKKGSDFPEILRETIKKA